MNTLKRKPELMSPAGYWPQLQAAIEAGADAVYFGLRHFSARSKVGFTLDELPEAIETLHQRGVKGFVTFNTLVFDHELELAETAIIAMANAGVDAVIAQDVGVCELIKKIAPGLEIHGSTQMSVTSAQGALLAQSLGCNRVVLGRELSLADIRKISESCDVELEVFVHGALCVSYSGQCFSSEAWGGRSANRGKCAQACRLSYDLIVDGEPRDLGPYRYLLSPGDLYTAEQIPELIDIGISCVKIEGRYKDADYVALTTKAYREAIDFAAMGAGSGIEPDEKLDLEQVYSRGLGPHFMSGTNHQTAVIGRAPRHRGVNVGRVVGVGKNTVDVELTHPLERGDGIVFDAADWRSPDEPEEGGNIYDVKEVNQSVQKDAAQIVKLEFGHGEIDYSRIRFGDLVWRTNDPRLKKRLKKLTHTEVPIFTRPISFDVTATLGAPIAIVATLATGQSANYVGEDPLEASKKRALDIDILNDKLGRLGGTPFHLGIINLLTSDEVFVPTSQLNQARRELVDELFETGGEITPIASSAKLAFELEQVVAKKAAWSERSSSNKSDSGTNTGNSNSLHLLVRTSEQLDAAILAAQTTDVASITLDYLELYGLRPSVEKIRAAGLTPRVASPGILKPSEQNVIRFLLSLECAILVRSGGLLYDLVNQADQSAQDQQKDSPQPSPELIGDFSLNAANAITAWRYLEMGLSSITPTYDLNNQQISDLTQWVPCPAIEVIAYSHLPVFHTEHCVFCRFLSDGTDNTNCGHPCEKHQVAVRDSEGRAHAVMADVGCRNTVFGAEAQTDPQSLQSWIGAGICNFRVEFVHQTPEQVAAITKAIGEFLSGDSSVEQLELALDTASPQSITQGSLYAPNGFKKLVQLS